MRQTSAQSRERTVMAITQRNMLQQRIEHSQKRLKALQGEARQSLQDGIAADQAALAELTLTLEQIKAQMRQEEKGVRRKNQEALRAHTELRAGYSLHHLPGGDDQWGPSQRFALLIIFAAAATMAGVLLLNR